MWIHNNNQRRKIILKEFISKIIRKILIQIRYMDNQFLLIGIEGYKFQSSNFRIYLKVLTQPLLKVNKIRNRNKFLSKKSNNIQKISKIIIFIKKMIKTLFRLMKSKKEKNRKNYKNYKKIMIKISQKFLKWT